MWTPKDLFFHFKKNEIITMLYKGIQVEIRDKELQSIGLQVL